MLDIKREGQKEGRRVRGGERRKEGGREREGRGEGGVERKRERERETERDRVKETQSHSYVTWMQLEISLYEVVDDVVLVNTVYLHTTLAEKYKIMIDMKHTSTSIHLRRTLLVRVLTQSHKTPFLLKESRYC